MDLLHVCLLWRLKGAFSINKNARWTFFALLIGVYIEVPAPLTKSSVRILREYYKALEKSLR